MGSLPLAWTKIYSRITSITTKLTGRRAGVFIDRYSLKDQEGKPTETTPEQMWTRVAYGIAGAEQDREYWAGQFYRSLVDFKFVPAGRILTGAGSGHKVTYYNCFVIPSPEDSRGGIVQNLGTMIEIMSRGGGVGINLSTLRPRGTYIKSVNGTSSGPVSWAQLYSVACGEVIQQGGSRRGALMLMLDDNHPDIEEFITVKTDLNKVNHANLSIAVSDAFMQAVRDDADWDLVWGGKVFKTLRARDLWQKICHHAWLSGEPGLVFLDRYNKESNTGYFEKIICVNPCGEQGLGAWNVCNLGAVNLAAFVKDGKFDYDELEQTVAVAVRFLDDVIDDCYYFLPENEKAQKDVRRIGLGTMGLATALIKLKIRYGSDECKAFIAEVYATIRDAAYITSTDLAEEKGAFPKFTAEYLERPFIQALPARIRARITKVGIRNAVLLTQAPTGTTSLLAGVSSGIEPLYEFLHIRKDRIGTALMYDPQVEEFVNANPGQPLPDYFVKASSLTPEEHVSVQALIQKYTDSSISKTVNAPNSHTVEQVMELYEKAYGYGCKGITYFRDGCREGVLSSLEECPSCGEPALIEEEGCTHCAFCTYSVCEV